MKKSRLIVLVLLGLVLGVYSISLADETLEASATLAEGVLNVVVTPINANGSEDPKKHTWGAATDALAFGELAQVSGVDDTIGPWTVFLPKGYFAIDVGFTGGGAVTGKYVDFDYDGSTPGPNGELLGEKVVAHYYKITKDASSLDVYNELSGSPLLLETSKTIDWDEDITDFSTDPGWLRSLVGIYSGKPKLSLSGISTFSPADPAGEYKGTLTVTLS